MSRRHLAGPYDSIYLSFLFIYLSVLHRVIKSRAMAEIVYATVADDAETVPAGLHAPPRARSDGRLRSAAGVLPEGGPARGRRWPGA